MKVHLSAFLVLVLALRAYVAQAPPTIEQWLKSKGIGMSRVSLLEALQSSQAPVRGAAAMQLAVNGDKESQPALREALHNEQDSSVALNIARALKTLGDATGIRAMQKICSSSSVRADLRLMAASEVPPEYAEQCFDVVVQTLHSDNPSEVQASLRYLGGVATAMPSVTIRKQNELSTPLIYALHNSVPSVRQSAAKCIELYKIIAARSALKKAEEIETDPRAKSQMKQSLSRLSR